MPVKPCPEKEAEGDHRLAVDEEKKGQGEKGKHYGATPDPDRIV